MCLLMGLTVCMYAGKAPGFLSMVMVAQALVISSGLWLCSSDNWSVLMVLLVYFGGVLVLFMYASCLSQASHPVVVSSAFLVIGIMLLPVDVACFSTLADFWQGCAPSSAGFFTPLGGVMSVLLILYLLVGLVVAVKLCKFYSGALRSTVAK